MTDKTKIVIVGFIFLVVIYFIPDLIRMRIAMDTWVLSLINNF